MFYFSFSTLSGKSNIELKVGDAAPLFSLKDQDKNTHKLSDYLGKKVVLYYFPKADTPGWTIQACGFRDIYDKYKKNDIVVFGLSYDSSRSLKKFKKKWHSNELRDVINNFLKGEQVVMWKRPNVSRGSFLIAQANWTGIPRDAELLTQVPGLAA